MKKSNGFYRIISIFLVLSILIVPVFALPDDSAVIEEIPDTSIYGCYSADATRAFLGSGQLVKNAKSVFLYELNSQTLMYAWQPDEALAPSSFVKILTAIVAIENGDLKSAVTVSGATLDQLPIGAVSVKLAENEVLTLEDLLYCMLVGSGNDAAAVIAQYIGGSQAVFVEMMNAFASQLGCTGSKFTNPHGLHDPQQLTTARDMGKILEYAMANKIFRKIFCTVDYTVPATNKSVERNLVTGNFMMSTDEIEIYFDERVIGGRTGVANDSTRCLATVAKAGSMELMCIVMGAASVYEEGGNKIRSYGGYNETKTLLDIGFAGYNAVQILYDGQALIQFDVSGGDSLLTVGPRTTISTVLPENATLADLSFRYSDESRQLQAPIAPGDKVCSVEVWYKELCIASADLYALNQVRAEPTYTFVPQQARVPWLLIIVLIVIVFLAAVAFFLIRTRYGRRLVVRTRRWIKKRRHK